MKLPHSCIPERTGAIPWSVFILAVLILALIYNYPQWITEPPQSIHNWRQSDCASLTLNYYQQDLPLTQPETHGMVSDYGTDAHNAPSELPVYYWGIAQLYQWFGPHTWLLRLINTLLFLSGIVAFLWTLYQVSRHLMWSLLLGLLLFTSPVLVFYGSNYLSNAPSFGMALWGMAFWVAFLKSGRSRHWWAMVVFYFLAGSFKLPGLFLFVTIGGYLLWSLSKYGWKASKSLIGKYLISLGLIGLPLGAWVLYARYYNALHHTVYFSTTTFPVWDYSIGEIGSMLRQMIGSWGDQYFHPVHYLFFAGIFAYLLARFARIPLAVRVTLVLLCVGLLLYFVLQFFTFVDHDYYTINMFILPALLLVVFSYYLHRWHPDWMRKPIVLVLLGVYLAGNILYARQQMAFRYSEYPNSFRQERPLLYDPQTLTWLETIGVAPEDTIIFIPDFSHTSLYLLNRHGWTNSKMVFKDPRQNLYFNQDSVGIYRSVENGASYLLVYGKKVLYNTEYLHPFLRHLSGEREELYVFNLRDTSRNYELPQYQLLYRQLYDFEDESGLPESVDSHQRSAEKAFDGQYALKACADDIYLAGTSLRDLEKDMYVRVRVWIHKTSPDRVVPVIQSETPGLVFAQEERIINENKGWYQLEQTYNVEEAVLAEGLKVFLWNPGGAEVYLDRYEILLFQ